MNQINKNPYNRANRAGSFCTPTFDAQSRASEAIFPLDGCDIATVSNERLIRLFDNAPKLHQLGCTSVVRLSQTLVMKSGSSVLPSEAKNMNYAAQLGGMRLPKVYGSFNSSNPTAGISQTRGYIVMDYVKGSCLADLWPNMNLQQRQTVITQVAVMIRKMQSTPLDFAGPVGGGMSQGLFFTDWGAGPFENGRAMEDWFNHKLHVCKAFKRVPLNAAPFEFSTFVFTHGDISPRNIILDGQGLVWLIDWQNAGSYPPQFEAAVIADQSDFKDFGEMLLKHIEHDEAKVRQLRSVWYALTTGAFL
ncbi:phosphotransferase family protein [Lindgomyces ingoldianus]|uniref:Phosphotransferase family protein n=1 Tax=Lindgomyces ingoldianus TaxID=673940 RepID=A0ACB6RFD9_9PLEO|nr:phosphotransferase family protein [Lindgomyces ingoldianus]KAF2477186.1 phosphotransferase family protein [Lindgomyces ingoldianus]